MQIQPFRCLALDLVQEVDELLGTMPLGDASHHSTRGDVERRVEAGRAVSFVVVRAPLDLTGSKRQQRLRAAVRWMGSGSCTASRWSRHPTFDQPATVTMVVPEPRPIFDFRRLAEDNLPLLRDWLNRPHLQEWWRRGEVSLAEVRRKYLPRMAGRDAARPFLAWLDGEPVGYIQYYLANEGDPGWWPDEPAEEALGIDQFLADPESLGRGLGTAMVSQFVAFLFERPEAREIRVDPRPDNPRAIRCYAKVGFRKVEEITTPDGPAVLMVLERSSAAGRALDPLRRS